MDGVKPLLLSKTVWGAVLSFASVIALKQGYELGDAGGWVEAIVGLFGAAFAVYGRAKAVKKIGSAV